MSISQPDIARRWPPSLTLALLGTLAVTLVGVAFVACGTARLPFNQVQTTMLVTPGVEGTHLTVTGFPSLIDSSIVTCETWHPSEDDGLGNGRFEAIQSVAVKDGAFVCKFDISEWPAGSLGRRVQFRV
jgi:hypothetical protein